jgi:hypothetical protein
MSFRRSPGVEDRIIWALSWGPQTVDSMATAGVGTHRSIQNSLTWLRRDGRVARTQAAGQGCVCVYWSTRR